MFNWNLWSSALNSPYTELPTSHWLLTIENNSNTVTDIGILPCYFPSNTQNDIVGMFQTTAYSFHVISQINYIIWIIFSHVCTNWASLKLNLLIPTNLSKSETKYVHIKIKKTLLSALHLVNKWFNNIHNFFSGYSA